MLFGNTPNKTNEEEQSVSEPMKEKEDEKFYFPRIQFSYCKDCRYCDYIQYPFQAISKCWCNYYDRRVNGYEKAWCTERK